MKAIIEHIVLVTRLLGAPVSEAALTAEVVRDKKLNVNYHSLVEVLRSHGFENTLSKRCLLYTSPSPRDVEESRMPSSA